ncbi:MAG: hypothetical protein JST93_27735 [Acidobacteria bacterium]|nr:hypothetical protein [Acidobacteriota bacterium]
MSKYEVSKSVEAVKLNKRTGAPLGQHPITLPFGAIIEHLEESGDFYLFSYMAERYRMRKDTVKGAIHAIPAASPAPASKPESEGAPQEPPKPALNFEKLHSAIAISRARIPGGWLVSTGNSVTFVPDPNHAWDGASL